MSFQFSSSSNYALASKHASCTNITTQKIVHTITVQLVLSKQDSNHAMRFYMHTPALHRLKWCVKLSKEYTIIAPSWMVASLACPRPSRRLMTRKCIRIENPEVIGIICNKRNLCVFYWDTSEIAELNKLTNNEYNLY